MKINQDLVPAGLMSLQKGYYLKNIESTLEVVYIQMCQSARQENFLNWFVTSSSTYCMASWGSLFLFFQFEP